MATKSVQFLTANRLGDGEVVYLAPGAGWVERLEAAMPLEDKAAGERALALAAQAVADRLVVSPYLIEAELSPAGILPKRKRETIRAAGPTVRRDLGKQADH